jgi:5-hydroxyisourate hydrolase
MSWLTTHVLDTARGRPAADVAIVCERRQGDAFCEVARGTTDADGRLQSLFPAKAPVADGVFRLTFDTAAYFARQGVESFFPQVQITFNVDAHEGHYHVPLLISPFGYSTYRGS